MTGLAKSLVGEQPCLLEPYLRARFKFDRVTSPELARWKTEHTAMLSAERDRLKADGWKYQVERFFNLTGQTAILTGKPDLIAQKPERRPVIVDTKSGQPKESDIVQVQIYLIAVPMAWNAPHMIFDGEVVYATHRVKVPHSSAEAIRDRVFGLLRQLATGPRPEASPSESSCRFCEVDSESCPDRWTADTNPGVLVSEW